MLKYKVLASQLTSLTDARFFAAHGVDWVSFLLTPDYDSSVDLKQLPEIKNWIEGPAVIGQFIQPSKKEIEEAIVLYDLEGIWVDADTSLETIQDGFSVPVFKEVWVDSENNLEQTIEWSAPFVDYFILKIPTDFDTSGEQAQNIQALCDTFEIILDTVETDNLNPNIINNLLPTGIVANATQAKEEAIGIKSFEALEPLFEFLQDETD